MKAIYNYLTCLLITLVAISFLQVAEAARIKDISNIKGVRSNQLIGYGLVVGLPGTGEKIMLSLNKVLEQC